MSVQLARRSEFFSIDGNILGYGFQETQLINPQKNWAEANPDEWWSAVRSALRDAVKSAGADWKSVVGVGVGGVNGLICLGEDGKPLTNVVMYMDQRSIPQAELMRKHICEKRILG